MEQGIPVRQHRLGESLVLHLGPGALIAAAYFVLAPVLQRAGYPSIMALMCSVALVLVPVEAGYLLYLGHKRNGRLSLDGVVLNRSRIPLRQYFVWVPVLFFIEGVVFTVLKAPSHALEQTAFSWVPTLNSGLDTGFSQPTLILTYAMVALFGAFVAPIVEELYFRGFLLPRMAFAGKWAPALHSLLFAVYHFWTPWQLVARVLGVIPIAYAAQRRNLYVGMVVHILVNLLDVATGVAFILAMHR